MHVMSHRERQPKMADGRIFEIAICGALFVLRPPTYIGYASGQQGSNRIHISSISNMRPSNHAGPISRPARTTQKGTHRRQPAFLQALGVRGKELGCVIPPVLASVEGRNTRKKRSRLQTMEKIVYPIVLAAAFPPLCWKPHRTQPTCPPNTNRDTGDIKMQSMLIPAVAHL